MLASSSRLGRRLQNSSMAAEIGLLWNCGCIFYLGIYRSSETEEMDVLISKLLFPDLHAKASVLILIFLMLVTVLCR